MTLSRRPLKSRSTKWARGSVAMLNAWGFSPNGVSVLSVVFAALALVIFFYSSNYFSPASGHKLIPLGVGVVLGAICIQLRLFCNLMDGLLAIEFKKKSPVGDLFNEVPDRIADTLIFIGFGFLCSGPLSFPSGIWLGSVASFLALFTAYLRLLGGALGLEQKFLGPQAKQHRMALVTLGCVFYAVFPEFDWVGINIPYFVLVLVSFGTLLTCLRRLKDLGARLHLRESKKT